MTKVKQKTETKFSVYIDGIHEAMQLDRSVPLIVEVAAKSKRIDYETGIDFSGNFYAKVISVSFNVKITVDEELSAYDVMRISENYFEVGFDAKERLFTQFDVVYNQDFKFNVYDAEIDLDGPKDYPDFLFLDLDDNKISIR